MRFKATKHLTNFLKVHYNSHTNPTTELNGSAWTFSKACLNNMVHCIWQTSIQDNGNYIPDEPKDKGYLDTNVLIVELVGTGHGNDITY